MNTAFRLWQSIIFIMGISLAFNESAHATPITIQIRGNVTATSGVGLPNTIHVGDIFTGIYTYDSLTPDSKVSPNQGEYQHKAPSEIRIFLGGYEFITKPSDGFLMRIYDDFTESGGYSYDGYYIRGFGTSGIPNISLYAIYWNLKDTKQRALSSDVLPVTAPVLSDWNRSDFQINSPNIFAIDGNITQAVLIPEPTSMLLLGLGGLLFRRK